ncbi:MAG: 4'-phosphopantetheinyl transferase superfamily protein [Rhizobium sp.]
MAAFREGEGRAPIELHSLHLRDGLHIPDSMLSMTEKKRAAAFRSSAARRLFVAGRVLCRGIIGNMVGCAPQALSLAITPSGRPYLCDYPEIDFNLSHSGDRLALAVCHGGRVGIDIERLDAFSEEIAFEIMPQILSDQELDRVQRLAAEERRTVLLSYWVRKEAALKCLGEGFLANPQTVTLDPDGTTSSVEAPPLGEPIAIRSGCFDGEESQHFHWAVATSNATTELLWRHHAERDFLTRFL